MRIATTEYALVRMAGKQIGLVLDTNSISATHKQQQFENLFYRFYTQLQISLDLYNHIGDYL